VETAEDTAATAGEIPSTVTAETAPDGALRWPAPDRDSPQIGMFTGGYTPDKTIGALLQMEGRSGRNEDDVKAVTGQEIKRPRRWHKIFERMGILYPGEGATRLARLGRLLREAARPDGMKRVIAVEVLDVLRRYQFDNPAERSLPDGNSVHPYWAVLRAASQLDWKIHWDEVNRELMRLLHDDETDAAIKRIRIARQDPGYAAFIGKAANAAGLLNARTHPADESAPEGKTPEGQLRDQRMTPFLKRVGFGELLLESPGSAGEGYWRIPDDARDVVSAAVSKSPPAKSFSTAQEWIEWFCEGTTAAREATAPPPPPSVATPIEDLTLSILKKALSDYEPDLVFSDELLASLIAAIRSGDGKNFIILRGVSGTGKSRLVSALSKAVFGQPTVDRPHLTIIEVRPDWTDGTPLLGHYDPIGAKYLRAPFLDAMLAATEDSVPVFVCLDEMNLARVEYYLADCLSAMESGNEIILDTRGDGTVANHIKWSPNLFIFGTVNIDESTLRISDKVLDRAQVIDTSDVDLTASLEKWLNEASALDEGERIRTKEILEGTWQALRVADAHFGFRTARAVIRFVNEAKASSDGALTVDAAIDAQLCQKVLTKIRGEGEHWSEPLRRLEEIFQKLGLQSRSAIVLRRMRRDLERFGSFQFWN
jgi:MoxR-like ATPase